MGNDYKHIPTGREANFEPVRIKATVDFNLEANQVTTVINTGVKCPAYHLVNDVYVVAREALDSVGGAATFAVGQDSNSDPDDFLNDEAEANLDANYDIVKGIPQAGDSATRIKIGAAATPIYVKAGTEAFIKGIVDIFVTFIPYK